MSGTRSVSRAPKILYLLNPGWRRSTLPSMKQSEPRSERFTKWIRDMPSRVIGWVRRLPTRVAGWIGRRRPRVWASIYIALIPLAGIVFWRLPAGSFYDSNLLREAGFKHDLTAVASLLTDAIDRQEYGYNPGHPLSAPTWSAGGVQFMIDTSSVYVPPQSVSVDTSGNITVEIRFFARSVSSSPFAEGEFSDLVTLSPIAGYESSSPGGQLDLADIPTSFATQSGPNNVQAPLNILLPQTAGSGYQDRSVMLVPLSAADVVERLSAAGGGDPKYASGLLIRMCYFSAITITTLGFGDITPVSSWARALVAIEAVFGVVFIGLFLNAVAQKWGKGP